MPLAAVLIDALHAAFEHGEEAFDRVRVNVAADVFILAVADGAMRGEVVADEGVDLRLVRHQVRFASDMHPHDRADRVGLVSLTWKERTSPPRSTSEKTACLWP